MALIKKHRRDKEKKSKKGRKKPKSWSDRLVTNLINNQLKNSRLWRRVREYIDSFFPGGIPIVVDENKQPQEKNKILVDQSNNNQPKTITGKLNNNQSSSSESLIFGKKSKLLIHGLSLWYDVTSFLLSTERLILDSEGHYTGTVRDYLAKIYREQGLLACISNREVMGPLARFFLSTLYTIGVQIPVVDTVRESFVESPLARQIIGGIDNILLMAVNYPIDTACLLKFKRQSHESTKQLSLVKSLKKVREENGVVNGWYRGFGWSLVENLLSETTSSLLTSGMTRLLCKLLNLDCGTSSEMGETILPPLTGDQLLLFNKLQSTTVDLIQDVLLAPLRFSILRYRTDMVNQYSSPIDCFKKVHSKEGFKTFYKGTWLGTFLAPLPSPPAAGTTR